MTRPAPTYCEHEGERYEAFQFCYPHFHVPEGWGLPMPKDFGITPTGCSTACWHGYRYGFIIEDGRLWISDVTIYLSGDEATWPLIHGVRARLGKDYDWYAERSPVWSGLRIPTTYTGPLPLVGPFRDGSPYVDRVRELDAKFPRDWPSDVVSDVESPWDAERLMPNHPKAKHGRARSLCLYRGLLDVRVEQGVVASVQDRSEELQRIRDRVFA